MEIHLVKSNQPLFTTSSPTFAGLTLTGQYTYLWGDADTEGSVRLNAESGSLKIEIRSATEWETAIGWPD